MKTALDPEPPAAPRLPLAGLRVVALEQAVSAPLCTRHLADLGADVIKVERPGGDFARHYDSVVQGNSSYFAWLNRGKRSIVLDLKRSADRAVLEALLERADVFVHNLGPGAVDRLGFDGETLQCRWPRLVACAISGYGQDGPYSGRKAFDLLLQGESGLISVTGTPEEPVKVGISIADISAGVYAFSAVLACLYERERTGQGRRIDVSMLECLGEWMTVPAYHQLYAGTAPPRTSTRHSTIVPYGPYRVGDGSRVNLAVQNDGQWERFCAVVLRRPELAEDVRFRTNEARLRNRAELDALIEGLLAGETGASVTQRLEAADVPFGSLNGMADFLGHPQLSARHRWFDVPSPGGPVRALAHPLNLCGLPQPAGGIPALGEHTQEVYDELGLPAPAPRPRTPRSQIP